eukprot:TRINITY_DN10116_c0_g1_i1.p1 TRINITY_DN10116_c0_g1~~TRINITY_DN10116_c0_g1_i1.p1  ORF type:complete len:661 (+),score=106.68 TRINITY_DN10116_c0_g1_i1:137-1984(+)
MAQKPDERVMGPAVSQAYRRSVMNVARQFLKEQQSIPADTYEPSDPAVELDLGDQSKLSFMKVAIKVTANSARRTSRASRFVTHLKESVEQSRKDDEEWQKEKELRQKAAADFRNSSVYSGLLADACELAASLNALNDSKSAALEETQRLAARIRDCTNILDQVHVASLQAELASLRARGEGALISKDLLLQLQKDIDEMQAALQQTVSKTTHPPEERTEEADSAENFSRQEKRLRTAKKLTRVTEQMQKALESFTAEEDDTEDDFLNASISQNDDFLNASISQNDLVLSADRRVAEAEADFHRQATNTSAAETDTADDLHQSRACSRASRPASTAHSEEDVARAALHSNSASPALAAFHSNSASHVPEDEQTEKEEAHAVPDRTSLPPCSHVDGVIDPSQEITSHTASKDVALPSIQQDKRQNKPLQGTPVKWSMHMESLDESERHEFMMESLSKEEWMLLDSCLSREEKGLKSLRAFYSCLPETELPKQQQSLSELRAKDPYRDAWAFSPLTLPAVLYSNDSLRPKSSRNVALYCYNSYISKYASRPASRISGATSSSPPPSRSTSLTKGLDAMAFPEKPRRPRQSLESLPTQTPLLHSPLKSPVGPCHLPSM